MKAKVRIFYKDSVFDPQGNTICESLQRLGYQTVKNVRIGKLIQIELEDQSPADADRNLKQMCEELLSNPVIESYNYEIEGPPK